MRIYKTAINFNENQQKIETFLLFTSGAFPDPGEGFVTIAMTTNIEATLFCNLICAKISNGMHPSVDDIRREWHYFSFLIVSSKFLCNAYPQLNDRPDFARVKEAGMRINAPAYMTDPDIVYTDMHTA